MILAEKIIRLRKKNGWSQEELAEKMNVSRQAVSKWEGAQSVPDLERLLQLAGLFGVTTDYLLKDEMEMEEFTNDTADSSVKRVTLEEANRFLDWRRTASVRIALAAFLCILSVIPLLILAGVSDLTALPLSQELACGIGLILLLIIISAAVAVFISCGSKNYPFEFLEKEPFETEYGVTGMVKERQQNYRPTYVKYNIIGTCICVLSPVPLFAGVFSYQEFLLVVLLAATMVLAGTGVIFFIVAGIRWASFQKLLKEGEYAAGEREKNRVKETVSLVYWLSAVAIYLGWSFLADSFKISWVVWPIAGILFAAVMAVCNSLIDKKKP